MDRPEFLFMDGSICVVYVFPYFHCALIPEDFVV